MENLKYLISMAALCLGLVGCGSSQLELNLRQTQSDLTVAKREATLLEADRDRVLAQLSQERTAHATSQRVLQTEIERLHSALKDARPAYEALEQQYQSCTKKLATAEISDRLQLLADVENYQERLDTQGKTCTEKIELVSESYFYKGALEVWDSVQIRGYPRVEEGIFFDDYYYIFELKLAKNSFSWEVKTESKETPFSKGLSVLGDIFSIVSFFK